MTDVPSPLVFVEPPPAPETFNVLLYGPPGAGKTTAAATAPGPLLWVNAEGPGALGYARKAAAERGTQISEVRLDLQTPDPRNVLRQVIEHVRSGADPKPATVVVDTVGKVRELLASQLVEQGAKNSMRQWGEVAKALGGFVRVMRDEPVNLVLIAHESIEDADGDRIVRPQIGGALSEGIPADVDVVAYCAAHRTAEGIQYLGQLVEDRGRRAKDRSGGLGVVQPLDLSGWLATYRLALSTGVPWEDPKPEPEPEPAKAKARRSKAKPDPDPEPEPEPVAAGAVESLEGIEF